MQDDIIMVFNMLRAAARFGLECMPIDHGDRAATRCDDGFVPKLADDPCHESPSNA